MKKISLLALIFIGSVLSLNTATHCMNRHHPLNEIEYALVLRQISLRGLSAVSQQIEKQTGGLRTEKVSLHIKETFCKNPTEEDPLTIAIFNKITEIESKMGYRPIKADMLDAHISTAINWTMEPTNYLGKYTRYYWEESGWEEKGSFEENHTIVRIESKITNKEHLTRIINCEKGRLSDAIDGKAW